MCEKTKGHMNKNEGSENWNDGWNWLCVPPFRRKAPGPLFGKSCAMGGGGVISRLVSSLLDYSHTHISVGSGYLNRSV